MKSSFWDFLMGWVVEVIVKSVTTKVMAAVNFMLTLSERLALLR